MTVLDRHFVDKKHITAFFALHRTVVNHPCERSAYQKHVMIPFGNEFKTWDTQESLNAGVHQSRYRMGSLSILLNEPTQRRLALTFSFLFRRYQNTIVDMYFTRIKSATI